MCDAPETSVEHVPPRAVFPKTQDTVDGVNLRKQLITVPACDAHNSAKSLDDEYLMYVLVLGILNNSRAGDQVRTKIRRAIDAAPGVAKLLSEHHVPLQLEDIETGVQKAAVAVRVDSKRVHSALDHIGRALYLHHYHQKWLRDVQTIPLFMIALDGPSPQGFNNAIEGMRVGVEALLACEPKHGANPEVFTYQVARVGSEIECVMMLTLYEGSKVVLLFKN